MLFQWKCPAIWAHNLMIGVVGMVSMIDMEGSWGGPWLCNHHHLCPNRLDHMFFLHTFLIFSPLLATIETLRETPGPIYSVHATSPCMFRGSRYARSNPEKFLSGWAITLIMFFILANHPRILRGSFFSCLRSWSWWWGWVRR